MNDQKLFVRIRNSNRWTINWSHPLAPLAVAAILAMVAIGVATGVMKPRGF